MAVTPGFGQIIPRTPAAHQRIPASRLASCRWRIFPRAARPSLLTTPPCSFTTPISSLTTPPTTSVRVLHPLAGKLFQLTGKLCPRAERIGYLAIKICRSATRFPFARDGREGQQIGRGGTRPYRRDGGQPVEIVELFGRRETHGGVRFEVNLADRRAVGKIAVGR